MRLIISFQANNLFSLGKSQIEFEITWNSEEKKFTLETDYKTRILKKKEILNYFKIFIEDYIYTRELYIMKIHLEEGYDDDYYPNYYYEFIDTLDEPKFRRFANKNIKKFLKELIDW